MVQKEKALNIKGNEKYLHDEFSEKLPLDHFLSDQKENANNTSRRDFLDVL